MHGHGGASRDDARKFGVERRNDFNITPYCRRSVRLTPLWNSLPANAAQPGAGSKSVREAATLPKLAMILSPCHEKPSL